MVKTNPFKRKREIPFPDQYIEVDKESMTRADD